MVIKIEFNNNINDKYQKTKTNVNPKTNTANITTTFSSSLTTTQECHIGHTGIIPGHYVVYVGMSSTWNNQGSKPLLNPLKDPLLPSYYRIERGTAAIAGGDNTFLLLMPLLILGTRLTRSRQ